MLMYLWLPNDVRPFMVNRNFLSEEEFIKSAEIELGYKIIETPPPAVAPTSNERWFKLSEPLFPEDATGRFY